VSSEIESHQALHGTEVEESSDDEATPKTRAGYRERHRHAARARGRLWAMPPGLSPFWRWVLGAVIAIQLVLIVSIGIVGAFRLPYFSPIDESAHYTYIQQIAEHGSLPELGRTKTSLQSIALAKGIYPRPAGLNDLHGLGQLSYEAFQPPLYYIAAVPAFLSTSNYRDKIYAVRLFDVVLLVASVVLIGRLARVVLGDRWLLGWSMVLAFVALPNMVVRFIFISDLALAVPLAVLFATELWIAWERHSARRLVGAGLVLGLCVLSELELILLIPIFALVLIAEGWRRRSARSWLPLLVAVAVPVAVMAPWFVYNEVTYHMLTAGPIAIAEQTAIINPHHIHHTIGELPNQTVTTLVDPLVLPSEWARALAHQPFLMELDRLLAVLIVPAGLVLIAGLGRRLWSVRTAILGLPFVLNIIELWYIRYGEQWAIDVRYTFTTVPILLVLVAVATDVLRPRFLPVLVTAGATASTVAIWGFLAFSYTGPYALRGV